MSAQLMNERLVSLLRARLSECGVLEGTLSVLKIAYAMAATKAWPAQISVAALCLTQRPLLNLTELALTSCVFPC